MAVAEAPYSRTLELNLEMVGQDLKKQLSLKIILKKICMVEFYSLQL